MIMLSRQFWYAMFFFSFILVGMLSAQPAKNARPKSKKETSRPSGAEKQLQKATTKALMGDVVEAVQILEKTTRKYPTYIKAYIKLGELQVAQHQYDKAVKTYTTILKYSESPVSQFNVHSRVGKIFQSQMKYGEAISHFEQCLAIETPDEYKVSRTDIERQLADCKFAKNALAHPVDFDPKRLSNRINSSIDEYLPMLTADESLLVFTRSVLGGVNANEDFFVSENQDSTWSIATSMGRPINTEYKEGAICISPDGRRLFFAAEGKKDSEGGFDLYYCIKSGDGWQGPFNLGAPINTRFWESQPSISADGKSLYFCSNRSGGEGKLDIWVSHLQKDNYWGEPQNLGKVINTPGDEQTPFIHPDGITLYFSSDGHIGMGDDDLYQSQYLNAQHQWSTPKNLGYPINTPASESGLVVTASGTRAYYAAKTDSMGLDLFFFDLPKQVQPNYVTYVKGIVTDAITKKPISATIELTDLDSNRVLLKTQSDLITGEFLVTLPVGKNYMYNVSKSDYLFHSENFSLKNSSPEKPYQLNVRLQPLRKPAPTTAKADTSAKTPPPFNVGQRITLHNVFFETAAFALEPTSFPELDKLVELLQAQPELRIEIGGHTDNTGKTEFNRELSANRAKSVYDYLVSKGIAASRLSYKGYADTQPIADNASEKGKAANRRTEIKILE